MRPRLDVIKRKREKRQRKERENQIVEEEMNKDQNNLRANLEEIIIIKMQVLKYMLQHLIKKM